MGERENPPTLRETQSQIKPQIKIELNEKLSIRYTKTAWDRLQQLYEKIGLRLKERYELFGTIQENAQHVYLYRSGSPPPIHIEETDYDLTIIDNVDDERIIRLHAAGSDKVRIVVNRGIFRIIPKQSTSEFITTIDYTTKNIYIVEPKKNFANLVKAIRATLNTLINEPLKAKYRFVIELYG